MLNKLSCQLSVIGVNPLVSSVHGVRTPPIFGLAVERKGVGRRGEEKGKGGKEGGHSLIFTWIDAKWPSL